MSTSICKYCKNTIHSAVAEYCNKACKRGHFIQELDYTLETIRELRYKILSNNPSKMQEPIKSIAKQCVALRKTCGEML